MGRKNVPQKTQIDLLVQTRRKCCLCVCLNNDFDEKKIQIAHIDRSNSNNHIDNLTPLCLDHHAQYDSVSKQYKSILPKELKAYKEIMLSKLNQKWYLEEIDRSDIEFEEKITKTDSISYMYSYGRLFAEVWIAINRHDPIWLVDFWAPIHEYSLEIRDITDRLIEDVEPRDNDIEKVKELVNKIMIQWFWEDVVWKNITEAPKEMFEDIVKSYDSFRESISSIIYK